MELSELKLKFLQLQSTMGQRKSVGLAPVGDPAP